MSMPTQNLKENANYVFNNIQGDNESYNGFGERILTIYAATYIAKVSSSPWLDSKLAKLKRYPDLVDYLKTFIDVNTHGIMNLGNAGKELPLDDQIAKKEEYKNSPLYYEMVGLTKFTATHSKQAAAIRAGAISEAFPWNLRYDITFQHAIFLINTFYVIDLVEKGNVKESDYQYMRLRDALSVAIKKIS